MANVEVLEESGAPEDVLGEHGHDVVGQVHLLQAVGDPLVLGEHLPCHKRDVVEAQVNLEYTYRWD